MTDHLRTQIRDAAKTALAGLATTGAHVYSARVSPLASSELPALLIFMTGDDGNNGPNNGGPTAERSGNLRIEAVAAAADGVLDTLDQIELEVVAALYTDVAFLALLQYLPLAHTSNIQIDEPVDGVSLRYASNMLSIPIQYRTQLGNPSVRV